MRSTPKKYELLPDRTDSTAPGTVLYQIRAIKDFADIKAGELGGYVSGEHNLDHAGAAWVSGAARVIDNAWVSGDALVSGEARVAGMPWW